MVLQHSSVGSPYFGIEQKFIVANVLKKGLFPLSYAVIRATYRGKLGHFALGPSLKGAPGGWPLEYLFKRLIYSNRAVISRYSNRAVTVSFRGAVFQTYK